MLLTIDSSETKSSHNEEVSILFNTPVELEPGSTVALVSCNVWYSWSNVSHTEYSNATWRYRNGTTWRANNVIAEGMYSLVDLQTLIDNYVVSCGDTAGNITLEPNYATGYCALVLTNGYQIDFSLSSFSDLLGFTVREIVTASKTGANKVDITRGVTSVNIVCDAISGSYRNGKASNILYSFSPTDAPGTLLEIRPSARIPLPMRSNTLYNMTMRLQDQLGRPLHIGTDPVSYSLEITKKS